MKARPISCTCMTHNNASHAAVPTQTVCSEAGNGVPKSSACSYTVTCTGTQNPAGVTHLVAFQPVIFISSRNDVISSGIRGNIKYLQQVSIDQIRINLELVQCKVGNSFLRTASDEDEAFRYRYRISQTSSSERRQFGGTSVCQCNIHTFYSLWTRV